MKNIFLLFLLFIAIQQNAISQNIVSGTISDNESKEPLTSVTVGVKSSTIGTSTDIDGKYELKLDAGKYVLVFSYVGFATIEKEIELNGSPLILDLTMLPEAFMNETVIVTDGKYEKKLEESTVSIDVIGLAQLESNNVTSLDEVVQKASGVQIVDGQVSIRGGAGYAYGVGSRVIFLVDGQALLSGELSDVKWNFMPIENAEQIEIIKGSASVLYGSGALNGVINLRTAYPKGDKPYTNFTMYAGIYDQPKIDSMRWFKPQNSEAAMPMFAGLYFAHRQKLHKNFDLVLGGNIHIKNSYLKDADERRFRLNFNTRYRLPKSDGRISCGINGNIMYHEEGRFFMAKDMASNAYTNLDIIYRDRYFSLTIDPYLTAFDNFNNKHDVRARWFRISKIQDINVGTEADVFSLEYQFQREFPKKWHVTAGVLGQYLHVNSILFANVTANWWDRALFTGGSVAAYAQVDKKFWDRLSVNLGVRWEGYVFDKQFWPTLPIVRVGVNVEASKNDFVRLSFGQGFRFPSMAERFFNEKIPGSFLGIYPNPNLLPEVGWSTEIAYRRTFNIDKFKIYADLAFFWMEYENMVEFTVGNYPPNGPGFSFINVSKARIAGWEISVQSEGRIGKFPLRIWGGYTYSYPGNLSSDTSKLRDPGVFITSMFTAFAKGVDKVNGYQDILKYRTLHTVRLDAETELWGVTIGAAVNYTSFMLHIDPIFSYGLISKGVGEFRIKHDSGYWVVDLRVGYRINEKQRINFIIQNLLNEEYAPRPALMGAPRSFSLKYTHTF